MPTARLWRRIRPLALLPRSASGHLNLGLARHRQAMARLGADQEHKLTTDLERSSGAKAIELHAAGRELDPRIDGMRLREAAAQYRRALAIDPGYALARANYGALLLDAREDRKARRMLQIALELDPENAGAWNNLGVALLRQGDGRKAREAFERSAALDPRLADPWFNLGSLHAAAGDEKAAAAAYAEYIRRGRTSDWSKEARARRKSLGQ